MSNKFKIGDRVRYILPAEEIGAIGKILSFEYCKITDNYLYCFEEEVTKEIFEEHENFFKQIVESSNKPHHNDPREMNKQHSIGFKGGQEVKVEPNGVCTMSNNIVGVKVYTHVNNKTEPSHYKNQSIEVWEMMIRIWGEEKFIAFCEMNAFKYRLRLGSKEGESIEDEIKKAQRYEQRANELR